MAIPEIAMFKTYPYVVRISQTKGSKGWDHVDVARRVENKDGTVVLRLKNMRKDIPFPDFKFVTPGPGGKQYIDYYSTAEGEFFPMIIERTDDVIKKKPIDKDALLWYVTDYDRRQKKYREEKGLWEKLMPVLMLGMVVTGFIANTVLTNQTAIQVASIQERMINDQAALWEKIAVVLDKADGVINDKTIITNNGGSAPAKPPI